MHDHVSGPNARNATVRTVMYGNPRLSKGHHGSVAVTKGGVGLGQARRSVADVGPRPGRQAPYCPYAHMPPQLSAPSVVYVGAVRDAVHIKLVIPKK